MNPFTPTRLICTYAIHIGLTRIQIRELRPETFENIRGFLILNRIRSGDSWCEVKRCLTVNRVGCSFLPLNMAVFNIRGGTPGYRDRKRVVWGVRVVSGR